ncbi:MAG: hypothetical protein FE78DRAFT_494719 [Acidomyces sp. 'richmondensis']|nr:MAG: hypothetical protein FE78DRAFT_494719 [Acidomyces sp. 'richmondensis']
MTPECRTIADFCRCLSLRPANTLRSCPDSIDFCFTWKGSSTMRGPAAPTPRTHWSHIPIDHQQLCWFYCERDNFTMRISINRLLSQEGFNGTNAEGYVPPGIYDLSIRKFGMNPRRRPARHRFACQRTFVSVRERGILGTTSWRRSLHLPVVIAEE